MAGNIQGSITYEIKVATEKAKREMADFVSEAQEDMQTVIMDDDDPYGLNSCTMTGFDDAIDQIEEVEEAVENVGREMQAIMDFPWASDALKNFEGDITTLEGQIQFLEQLYMDLLNKRLSGNGTSELNAQLRITMELLQQLKAQRDSMASPMDGGVGVDMNTPDVNEYTEATEQAGRATEETSRKINGLTSKTSLISRLADGAKRLASAFKDGFAKSLSGAGQQIQKASGSFVKMGLAMVGVRSLFAALRKAVNAYMAENEGLSAKLSGIWSGLGNVLGPVIERVINLLGTAIGYITKFISALGSIAGIALGNSKALNKQAKATGGAGGAAAKASKQLAAFDEMNKLSDNASGGGGGGGGASAYDWSSEVTLPDWAQMVAENIKKGDWYSAGAILGEKFTEMFTRIDWAMIAQKLSNGIHNLFAIISGFFENTDWLKLGESIATFIANINWKQLVQDIARLAGNIIGASAALVKGLFGNAWKTLSDWFHKNAMDGGKFTIEGLWNGILDAMKNAWQWIKENIFQPFWDGLCKAFGIASPSKKMKEIGGHIIDGLKEGIQNGISTIVSKCTELWNKVKNVFSNVGSWFKTTFQTAWTNVQNVFSNWGSFFSGLWNKISSTFSSLGTSIASAISGSVKNGINNVIGKIQNTINSAIGVINRAIAVMNTIPGVHANSISTISLPRLARGAIVNNPGRGVPAIIGEAGREAVLPLEQNTEWMDILAEKIGGGGNVTIPIYLDNRKIAEYVVDTQKRRAFALNGGY